MSGVLERAANIVDDANRRAAELLKASEFSIGALKVQTILLDDPEAPLLIRIDEDQCEDGVPVVQLTLAQARDLRDHLIVLVGDPAAEISEQERDAAACRGVARAMGLQTWGNVAGIELVCGQLSGLAAIAHERARQFIEEGWSPAHDDKHINGEIADAAACYAATAWEPGTRMDVPRDWPWDRSWWKPTPNDRIRQLVKAGALIAAEIDRLQRAEAPAGGAS